MPFISCLNICATSSICVKDPVILFIILSFTHQRTGLLCMVWTRTTWTSMIPRVSFCLVQSPYQILTIHRVIIASMMFVQWFLLGILTKSAFMCIVMMEATLALLHKSWLVHLLFKVLYLVLHCAAAPVETRCLLEQTFIIIWRVMCTNMRQMEKVFLSKMRIFKSKQASPICCPILALHCGAAMTQTRYLCVATTWQSKQITTRMKCTDNCKYLNLLPKGGFLLNNWYQTPTWRRHKWCVMITELYFVAILICMCINIQIICTFWLTPWKWVTYTLCTPTPSWNTFTYKNKTALTCMT